MRKTIVLFIIIFTLLFTVTSFAKDYDSGREFIRDIFFNGVGDVEALVINETFFVSKEDFENRLTLLDYQLEENGKDFDKSMEYKILAEAVQSYSIYLLYSQLEDTNEEMLDDVMHSSFYQLKYSSDGDLQEYAHNKFQTVKQAIELTVSSNALKETQEIYLNEFKDEGFDDSKALEKTKEKITNDIEKLINDLDIEIKGLDYDPEKIRKEVIQKTPQ